jgi:hypothetical protein
MLIATFASAAGIPMLERRASMGLDNASTLV